MRTLLMGVAGAALVALAIPSRARPQPSEKMVTRRAQQPATQVGLASWYGEAFSRKPTASGEPYDMNGLTAAHKELPLHTRILVTNLRNNKSVTLRVNDRGPYIAGRILDVSSAAATLLGFQGRGLTTVRVEVISHLPLLGAGRAKRQASELAYGAGGSATGCGEESQGEGCLPQPLVVSSRRRVSSWPGFRLPGNGPLALHIMGLLDFWLRGFSAPAAAVAL